MALTMTSIAVCQWETLSPVSKRLVAKKETIIKTAITIHVDATVQFTGMLKYGRTKAVITSYCSSML